MVDIDECFLCSYRIVPNYNIAERSPTVAAADDGAA